MENILVVGDLHSPFIKEGYLEHCHSIRKKYKCKKVVFIGDIQDSHASSYHEMDPDGYSAGEELDVVKIQLKNWKKVFKRQDVYCVIGNHDAIPARKMLTSGVSKNWIKEFPEVYDTPDWKYNLDWNFHNVVYTHGLGSSSLLQAILNSRTNLVMGHYHTKFEIVYNASKKDLLWGMFVGCGINSTKYAFAYAKNFVKKPILGCGVVLDNGRLPILEPMLM